MNYYQFLKRNYVTLGYASAVESQLRPSLSNETVRRSVDERSNSEARADSMASVVNGRKAKASGACRRRRSPSSSSSKRSTFDRAGVRDAGEASEARSKRAMFDAVPFVWNSEEHSQK